MPNYRIIGADRTEYGPVSTEQIRQWIAERRVDSETKLQVEGAAEWKRLAEVPEFAEPLPGSSPSSPPYAGEARCPRCKSNRIAIGHLGGVFGPRKLRVFVMADVAGVRVVDPEAQSCLDCGFLWSQLDKAKLETFIRKHCTKETKKEWRLSD